MFPKGAVLSSPHHEFKVDDEIHLIFTEPADFSPIPCRVRRVKPWRVDSRHLPGVGLALTDIDKNQLACLLDLPG